MLHIQKTKKWLFAHSNSSKEEKRPLHSYTSIQRRMKLTRMIVLQVLGDGRVTVTGISVALVGTNVGPGRRTLLLKANGATRFIKKL